MNNVKYFIGIDISSEFYTVSVLKQPEGKYVSFQNFDNSLDGFKNMSSEFQSHGIVIEDSIVCMEATGVYNDHLAYYLVEQGFKVSIENPLKVKRSFSISNKKTDSVDSQQIAEYSYRFLDKLQIWTPKDSIIEGSKALLNAREQFVKQKTALTNAKHAESRKKFPNGKAIEMYDKMINEYNTNIKLVENEIKELIKKDPNYQQRVSNVMSIPGIGLIITTYLFAYTNGFSLDMDYKKLCNYIGIAPLEHQSGKSIHRKPTSSKVGPGSLRKLLYLAAMVSKKYNKSHNHYYLRKTAEGKSGKLVLNNIGNKLLKLVVAIVKSGKPFNENFCSINPIFLKNS
jgi:transposase